MKKKKTDIDYWVKVMDCRFAAGLVSDHYFMSGDDMLLKMEEAEWLLNKKGHKINKKYTRSGATRTKWKS